MAPNLTLTLKRHRPHENIHRKQDTKKCKRVEDESVAMFYEEQTTYDILLASLGLSDKVVADMKKRRHRQDKGKSYTERYEDNEMQGANQESLRGLTKNTDQENNEKGSEDCVTEEEHDLTTNGLSSSTSAFSEHLSHKLSSKEAETLSKGKWKFEWEAPAIGMPNRCWKGTRPNFRDVAQSDATYGLKPKLFKYWLQLYEKSGRKYLNSSNRRRFFSICSSYMDILHSNKRPFYNKGLGEDLSHMDAYLMHSLSHIFRTRDLMKKNESKISKLSEEEVLSDDGFRDQGFTRPKVLILLPYKSIAFRVVKRLIQLTPAEAQRVNVDNLDRFNKEFGCDDGDVKTFKYGNQPGTATK